MTLEETTIISAIVGYIVGFIIAKIHTWYRKKYGIDAHQEVNDYMSKTYAEEWSKLNNK